MSYLVAKIVLWLGVATFLGLALGWVWRGARARKMLQRREAEWGSRLANLRQAGVVLQRELDGLKKKHRQLIVEHDQLMEDHKSLAQEYEQSAMLVERLRRSLKRERDQFEKQHREFVSVVEETREEMVLLKRQALKADEQRRKLEAEVARLKKRTRADGAVIADLNTYLEAANDKKKALQEENYRLGKALDEASVRIKEQDGQIARLRQEGQNFAADARIRKAQQREIEELKQMLVTSEREGQGRHTSLERQISSLQEEKKRLEMRLSEHQKQKFAESERAKALEKTLRGLESRLQDVTRQYEQTSLQLQQLERERDGASDALRKEVATLQQQLRQKESDLEAARADIGKLERQLDIAAKDKERLFHSLKSTVQVGQESLRFSTRNEADVAIVGVAPEQLDAPRQGRADDLKRISGIGPRLEKLLNDLGIYHYSQIAALTPDNIKWLDVRLHFSGRIERENWVEQARVLAAGDDTEFSERYDQVVRHSR